MNIELKEIDKDTLKMEMCEREIKANACPEDCDMCIWDVKGGVSYENH